MAQLRSLNQLSDEPIFVVGAARSGTTWVYDILTSHPEVAGVHESWLFTPWGGLGALFTSHHWPPGYSGLGRLLERRQLLSYTKGMAVDILSQALEPGHRFLVEKSPPHLFATSLISELFPGSRFIHVLRDGRDVSVSVRAATKSWAPAWGQSFGRSVKTQAGAWRNAVNHVAGKRSELCERFLEIRYETIHADPLAAYRSLFDFCGIPYDDTLLDAVFDRTDFSRNYRPKEHGFRRGGRIGDWRSRFSLLDAIVFDLVAGNTLIALGYEENHRWLLRYLNPLDRRESDRHLRIGV